MNQNVKKAVAATCFIISIACVVYALWGSMIAVIVGAGAAALACSIAEDIEKEAKRNRL